MGVEERIAQVWQERLSATTEIKLELDRIYATSQNKIIEIVKKNTRVMQMLRMLCLLNENSQGVGACDKFLAVAQVEPFSTNRDTSPPR
jgi:hypothetical protein